MSQTTTNAAAHEILQAAHDHAYHYPKDFAGFKAMLHYSTDDKTYDVKVIVHAPDDIMIEPEGKADELKALQSEIVSICRHRWYAPYSAGDGRYTLSLDENTKHPLGQLIIFHDDPFKSSYRIKDNSIVQVNRQMGTTKLTIFTQEQISVEGNSLLPSQVTAGFWDTEQKRLTRSVVYTNRYVPIEGYYLHASRRMIIYSDDGVSTHLIEFSAHEII